jgi:hypothetical protein
MRKFDNISEKFYTQVLTDKKAPSFPFFILFFLILVAPFRHESSFKSNADLIFHYPSYFMIFSELNHTFTNQKEPSTNHLSLPYIYLDDLYFQNLH